MGSVPQKAARANAAGQFEKDVLPTELSASSFFRAVDPENWKATHAHRAKMVQDKTGCQQLHENQCHTLMAWGQNRTVRRHKDTGDAKRTMATWTCAGLFAGGHLGLSKPDYRLRFLPDDLMVLRATLVEHWVTPFVGSRTLMVWTSKSDAKSVVPHVSQMSSEERQQVMASKSARDSEAQALISAECEAEKARIASWTSTHTVDSQEDQYKLDHIHLNFRKLNECLTKQRVELKRLARANATDQEILEFERRPSSLLYEIGEKRKLEKRRLEQGLNPFLAIGGSEKDTNGLEDTHTDESPGKAATVP